MTRCAAFLLLNLFSNLLFSATPVVNVYVWGGEIPKQVIHQFEEETGIHVNFSTYDSNETLFAKLKANTHGIYDVILPSSYFVERMRSQNMLTHLDKHRLSNLKHLDPLFRNNRYDPDNQFNVPLIWGATGIFFNRDRIKKPLSSWNELWGSTLKNQLLLMDDSREVFAMALLSLGYLPNDSQKEHIQAAFNQLLTLIPNIKLFSSEGIQAILIDEDAIAGMVWNGDALKAHTENKAIEFVYPKDGFVLWVDCLAIPANAPHLNEAYAFINFLFRPDISMQIGLSQGHAITNLTGRERLPSAIQNNPMIYPPPNILARGYFQEFPGEEATVLYNEYWQQLKLAF